MRLPSRKMEPKDLPNMEMVRAIDFGSMNMKETKVDRDSEAEGASSVALCCHSPHCTAGNHRCVLHFQTQDPPKAR